MTIIPPARTDRTRVFSVVILSLLCVIATGLRIAIAGVGELWRDEALFLAIVDEPSLGRMMKILQLSESHPPLYYLLERVWHSIAGRGDVAALTLPVAFGVLLVPIVYFVGRSIFSERVGLLAAAFVAISPPLVEHSAMARPYSLLPILTLVASYTLWRGLLRGGKVWIAYVMSTVCLVYTHNWAWLVVGASWIAVAISLWSGVGRPRVVVVREWMIAQLAIAICFLPWLPYFVYQSNHAGHMPTKVAVGLGERITMLKTAVRVLLHGTIFPGGDAYMVGAAKLLLVALLVWDVIRRRRRSVGQWTVDRKIALTVLLGIPVFSFIAATVLSTKSNLLFERCIVMLAPLVFIVLASWLLQPRSRAGRNTAFAFSLFLIASYRLPLTALIQTARSDARALSLAVAERAMPTDLVIIAPEWMASSFNRYFPARVEQIDYPHFGRESVVNFSNVKSRMKDQAALSRALLQIADARQSGRRVWLIMDSLERRQLTPDMIARADSSPEFAYIGMVRANQLMLELTAKYGLPDTSLLPRTRPTRFEHLKAYLFKPSGSPPGSD